MRDLNSWTALACLLFSVACGREQPPERPPPQTGEAQRDAGVAQEKRRKPKRGAAPDAPRMNGYALEDFGDFTREWAFVTVRYRMDSGEQRITYANDLAMAALKAGGTDYPDGAMFAKVGALTEEDASFPNSLVPAGRRRFQFMVRDKAKHAATDGWGYVLFQGDGKVLPEDPIAQAHACAACHRIVPERGYVFSQLMNIEPDAADTAPRAARTTQRDGFSFVDTQVTRLPPRLQAVLPRGAKAVRRMEADFTDQVFLGTLNEVRPLLIEESVASKKPAAFVSKDQANWTAVYVESVAPDVCPSGQLRAHYMVFTPSPTRAPASMQLTEEQLREGRFCLQRPVKR